MGQRADEGDRLSAVVGDASAVRAAFDQAPMIMISLTGPDYRIAAVNRAGRAFLGGSEVIGLPLRHVLPELAGQQIAGLLGRVYATSQSETSREWRLQLDRGPGEPAEAYLDLTVQPWRSADGAAGLLVVGRDVTTRVLARLTAADHADEAAEHHLTERGVIADLQEALLPIALPVLPQARLAARYLVAGQDRSAGGDWFDAITMSDGTVVLTVGDVVGHGISAAAAMAQVRAVLNELLLAEPDLATVLDRVDRFAARTPPLRAATLVLAALNPADGLLRYVTCGHPPPLITGRDGSTRFLPATPGGPLGTGASHHLATSALARGDLLLLYSDGLIERPGRTLGAGMAELAGVAGDAVASGGLRAADAAPTVAERVCQLTVELLTRGGYHDDVTVLAVERLTEPVPELHLELPAEVASLTTIRRELRGWLGRLDPLPDDQDGVHMAVVETVTNAIEHAYPAGSGGTIEFDLSIRPDGLTECLITDYGTWRPPDPAAADRGNGLMVAERMVDQLQISHPARADGASGTTVRLLHQIRRPAMLGSGPGATAGFMSSGPEPTAVLVGQDAFAVTAEQDGRLACAWVRGLVDISTADELLRKLLAACRGGTLPLRLDLSGVTQLASAGVSALYHLLRQLTDHDNQLTLVVPRGGAVQAVLQVVGLPYTLTPQGVAGA